MVDKYDALPKDIKWHMIGHLQSNKVKYMAHFVDLIHGVDKFKTLKEINKQAKKHDRVIDCLLQAKIAKEDTKFGLSFDEIEAILSSNELSELKNINIVGFMGMATFTDNKEQLQEEFSSLKSFFCLYDWMIDVERPDLARRVTPYINHFESDYIKLVLNRDYDPTIEQLIDDYLEYNPTRNRNLDMLPLFAFIDEKRVRSVVDDPRVNARPTFHYRLPNTFHYSNSRYNIAHLLKKHHHNLYHFHQTK